MIKFDHAFIGREALEKRADGPHRKKVTLGWNPEDAMEICASQLREGENGKFMETPSAHYAAHPYDKVVRNGKIVGFSTYPAYFAVHRQWISLATIEEGDSDVTIVWGEENGGSRKPGVERHFQKQVRATTAPWPYSKSARENYRRPDTARSK